MDLLNSFVTLFAYLGLTIMWSVISLLMILIISSTIFLALPKRIKKSVVSKADKFFFVEVN